MLKPAALRRRARSVRMQYFVVMIDYGRRGREAIVDPEITRREVVSRIASGEYSNISFIHEIADCAVRTSPRRFWRKPPSPRLPRPALSFRRRASITRGICASTRACERRRPFLWSPAPSSSSGHAHRRAQPQGMVGLVDRAVARQEVHEQRAQDHGRRHEIETEIKTAGRFLGEPQYIGCDIAAEIAD